MSGDLYFIERADGRRFLPDGKHSLQAVKRHLEQLSATDEQDGYGRVEGLRVGRVLEERIEYLDAGSMLGRCRR